MRASVIICTYNRARRLPKTLAALTEMAAPPGLEWELLLVDNNSTDDTKAVCERFCDRLPLRYLMERKQGKSHALNCGIEHALSDLMLFTDDDASVDPRWMAEYLAAAEARPEAGFLGGRIIPEWEDEPPRWLKENSEFLSSLSIHYDRGPDLTEIRDRRKPFFGANLALRKSALRQAGSSFRPEFGIVGNRRIGGEEQMVMFELVEAGFFGLYVPTAIVRHRNIRERMTESYLRKISSSYGRLEVKCGEIPLERLWLGAPRYLWRQLVADTISYLITRPFGPAKRWLDHEIRAAMAWGSIQEFWEGRKAA